MTATAEKPSKINPPPGLDRAETRAFRRLIGELQQRNRVLDAQAINVVADLVTARTRAAKLSMILDGYMAKARNGTDSYATVMVLKLAKQIDATTSLATRLAGKLGVAP